MKLKNKKKINCLKCKIVKKKLKFFFKFHLLKFHMHHYKSHLGKSCTVRKIVSRNFNYPFTQMYLEELCPAEPSNLRIPH